MLSPVDAPRRAAFTAGARAIMFRRPSVLSTLCMPPLVGFALATTSACGDSGPNEPGSDESGETTDGKPALLPGYLVDCLPASMEDAPV
jgi:hypothetical protein